VHCSQKHKQKDRVAVAVDLWAVDVAHRAAGWSIEPQEPGRYCLRTLAAAADEPPRQRRESLAGLRQPALDRVVADSGRAPAVQQAVHRPDHQIHQHAGKHDVGEKMRAGADAHHAGGSAEGERRGIGERSPLRRRQSGRRQRPERAGRLAGNERAIVRTIATRIPPRRKAVGAAELTDVDRPRAGPVILEDDVGEETGAEHDGHGQEQRGAARHQHPPLRPDELAEDGEKAGQSQRGDERARHPATRLLDPGVRVEGEADRTWRVGQGGNVEVELRINCEDDTRHHSDGDRDGEAGSIHAARPFTFQIGFRSLPRAKTGHGKWHSPLYLQLVLGSNILRLR
jgi:hypothetical protein